MAAEQERAAAEQERVAAEAEAEAKRVQMEKEEAEAEAKRVQMENEEAGAEAKRVREERLENLRLAAESASRSALALKQIGVSAHNAVAFNKAEEEREAAEEERGAAEEALIAEELEQERVAAEAEAEKRKIDEEWALLQKKKAEEEAAREARIQAEELELDKKEERIQNGLAPSGRWYFSPKEKEVTNLTYLRGIVTLFVEEDTSAEVVVGVEGVVGVVDGEYDRRDNARARSGASATITGKFFADNSLKLAHSSESNGYEWDIQFTEVVKSTAVDFRSSPVDKLTGTWSRFSTDRRSGGRPLDLTEFVAYRLEDINEICGKMLEKVQTIAGVQKLLKESGKLPKANLKPCYYLTRYNFHHLNRKANESYPTHDDRKNHADCLWSREDALAHTTPYFNYCDKQESTPGGDVMINTRKEVDDQEKVVVQEFLREPRLHGPNCEQKYMWETLQNFIYGGDMEKYILTNFGMDLSFIGFQAALTEFKEDMEDKAKGAFLGPDQFKRYIKKKKR